MGNRCRKDPRTWRCPHSLRPAASSAVSLTFSLLCTERNLFTNAFQLVAHLLSNHCTNGHFHTPLSSAHDTLMHLLQPLGYWYRPHNTLPLRCNDNAYYNLKFSNCRSCHPSGTPTFPTLSLDILSTTQPKRFPPSNATNSIPAPR